MLDARKVILGIVLAVAAAGSWWLTHQVAVPTPSANLKPRHEPDYIVKNFVGTTMDEKGVRKYHLTAKQLTHFPDDDTTHLVQPVLVQFQPGGSTATTRADEGLIPGGGGEIIMVGNVRLTRATEGRADSGEVSADRLRVELDR